MRRLLPHLRRKATWIKRPTPYPATRSRAAGDTIVEVLIAAAIITLVLTGAYRLSNRSTSNVEDTQEHQQATSLATTQLELLRANQDLPTTFDCLTADGPAVAGDDGGTACSFSREGNPGCTTTNPAQPQPFCYQVAITSIKSTGSSSDPTIPARYKVEVTWDSLLGGQAQVALYYGLVLPNPAYVVPAGGGGGYDGPPAFTNQGCGAPLPPCQPQQHRLPAYHYDSTFVNQTTKIPDNEIAGCIWNFGDGQTSTTGCHLDDHVYDTFPANGTDTPAYPANCPGTPGAKREQFTVTLVIIKTDGSRSVEATQPVSKPSCW